ncbi:MAG: PIN domain-containing protein [Thermosynechococcaceae cyanobacterium]
MRVLYDTNVILDVLWPRPEFLKNSSLALSWAMQDECEGYLAAHAVTTIDYIGRKSPSYSRASLMTLLKYLKIAAIDQAVIQNALISSCKDFEDAVTQAAADAVCADMIVTRDLKDFSTASVPVFEPALVVAQMIEP